MKTSTTRQDQGIPGVYGLLLLDVVSRWGYSDETLFAPFHLTSEQLADPNYRIPTPIANELVKHSLRLTGESTLGFHLGTQMRISIHGFIGYAIMTAHDITDAIALASRFIQLRLPFLQLYFSTFGPKATLQLQCDIEVEPLRTEIILGLTIGIMTMARALTGIEDLSGEVDLDFPEPAGFDKYRDKLSSSIRFNQPHLISSFDKKYLGLKMVNADPIASQIAINQCETELSALGERRRLAMRVRDILTNSEQHYLSIESVAERLHMSDRTLKRQLAAEGTSFSTLVDEVRYRHATSLLSRTDYSLEQIADELGYSDVANFSRAFKRWSGRSPSNWRKDPYL
ncbi:AraC family transcriptional regulator ligand-binding domain-containing protein [Acinetobacter vivianii]|uniref:AraC family transcriptional regulator ligand-binding domain-containing protein n=1 Tax=Acinetobacter vivianii TaxID=1776742 RepID=A0AAJ6P6K5_9GAMM|nr:AraC family transcriptional regulator [Acinetobacter vivianii]MEB6665986.1 AraC family transcriptional regulator [Acinetobacter vivianii]WDZ52614.1 AraC family transcriptional regulator ligand-binding domain-containing protein [Acinetobacter vivianii]